MKVFAVIAAPLKQLAHRGSDFLGVVPRSGARRAPKGVCSDKRSNVVTTWGTDGNVGSLVWGSESEFPTARATMFAESSPC